MTTTTTNLSPGEPTADSSTKTCCECGELRPVTEFRLERKNGTSRRSQCCECHRLRERVRAADKRSAKMNRLMKRLCNARDERRVQTVCNAMVSQFGGLNGFVNAWRAEFDAAPAGSRLRHTYLAGVFQLLKHRGGG